MQQQQLRSAHSPLSSHTALEERQQPAPSGQLRPSPSATTPANTRQVPSQPTPSATAAPAFPQRAPSQLTPAAMTTACPQQAPAKLSPSATTPVFPHQQHAAAAPPTAYRSACSTRRDAGFASFHTPVSWGGGTPFTPLSTAAPRSASGPRGSGSRITAEEFAALPPSVQMFAPPSLRMGLTPEAAVEGGSRHLKVALGGGT